MTTTRGTTALAAFALAFGLTAAAYAQEADADRGERLFKRYCAGCHGVDGRGGAHTFMPHVGNLAREGYIEYLPDERLELVILEGGEAIGLSAYMPAWQDELNAQDVRDIIAHIRRLARY